MPVSGYRDEATPRDDRLTNELRVTNKSKASSRTSLCLATRRDRETRPVSSVRLRSLGTPDKERSQENSVLLTNHPAARFGTPRPKPENHRVLVYICSLFALSTEFRDRRFWRPGFLTLQRHLTHFISPCECNRGCHSMPFS